MTYKFTIPGAPVTKKNSQKIIMIAGRPSIAPSSQFKNYEKTAMFFLLKRPNQPIDYPVHIRCTYFMPTRRHVDLTNLLEATDDVLVKAGVIEDDNRNIVGSHDYSRVYYDKKNPRVEITITPMHPAYEQWQAGSKAEADIPAPITEFDEEHWD